MHALFETYTKFKKNLNLETIIDDGVLRIVQINVKVKYLSNH